MKLNKHLEVLAKRAKSEIGNVLAAYEVKEWPEGRLDKLIEMCPEFTWRLLRNFEKRDVSGRKVFAPLFYGKRMPELVYPDGRGDTDEN